MLAVRLCFLVLFVCAVSFLSVFPVADARSEIGEVDVAANAFAEVSPEDNLHQRFSTPGPKDHVLLKASARGDVRTVLDILRHDPEIVNDRNEMGWTALTFAAANGHNELVHALIEAGADPNVQEADQWTPLMFAAFYGDEAVLHSLLNSRKIDTLLVNAQQLSAHALARLQGHTAAAHLLGTAAMSQAIVHRNFPAILAQIELGMHPDTQTASGWTALIAAIDTQHLEFAQKLLREHRANVNMQEADGWAPLMFAVYKDDVAAVQLLLSFGADITLQVRNRKSRRTVIEMAEDDAGANKEEILKLLRAAAEPLKPKVQHTEAASAAHTQSEAKPAAQQSQAQAQPQAQAQAQPKKPDEEHKATGDNKNKNNKKGGWW